MKRETFYIPEEEILKLGGYDPSESSVISANFGGIDVKFEVALHDDYEKNGVLENVLVSKVKFDCLKLMTNDLLKAEAYLNEMGIETRLEDTDTFRNMPDIIKDIAEKYHKEFDA